MGSFPDTPDTKASALHFLHRVSQCRSSSKRTLCDSATVEPIWCLECRIPSPHKAIY
jgi:hypothetical protein